MPANFLSLPAELRNNIYKYLLVCSDPVIPWNGGLELATNLLATNKKILHEASSLLYGNNCFDLSLSSYVLISGFLDTIGLMNASHLKRIRIDFPEFCDPEDNVDIEEDSLRTLAKIQTCCTNLRSITATAGTTYFIVQLSLDFPKICDAVLALVDTQLRKIVPLQEIIVEIYSGDLNSYIEKKMQRHGWTPKAVEEEEVVEEEEEWDSDVFWHDMEDRCRFSDNSYDDDSDDYDIDNDSDFWRRAAD